MQTYYEILGVCPDATQEELDNRFLILVRLYHPDGLHDKEDQGLIMLMAEADPYVTLKYLESYTQEINSIAASIPEIEKVFLNSIARSNSGEHYFVLIIFTENQPSTIMSTVIIAHSQFLFLNKGSDPRTSF